MKKSVFLLFLSISLLSANKFKNAYKKEGEINTLKFNQFVLNFDIDKFKTNPVFKRYIEFNGIKKEQAIQDLIKASYNKNWKKAIYNLYYKVYKYKINFNNKGSKEVLMPDIKEGLFYLNKSVKETKNPFIAFEGLDLIMGNFLMAGRTEEAEKYTRGFAKVLAEKRNSCLGYLMWGRSYFKDITKNPNYTEAKKILEKGLKECNKKNIPNYYPDIIRHYLAKAKALIKLGAE